MRGIVPGASGACRPPVPAYFTARPGVLLVFLFARFWKTPGAGRAAVSRRLYCTAVRKCPVFPGKGEGDLFVATLSITDLKAGLGVNIKGKDCVILEAQHVKPGKGNTYVRTKYRDIRTGRVNEENFQQSAKFESVDMRTREMQYLYDDGTSFWFMDTETYEQIPVDRALIGDNDKFLKENDICLLQYANDVLYAVQPPTFIEVEITETDPGFKGDTVQGGTKPAVIETGATIQVPMYLNQGEKIKVDTRDGKFVARV